MKNLLTDADACVSFFKAWTGKNIFKVSKLRRRDEMDEQLVRDGVDIGGLQMSRRDGCRASLVHGEDVSCKKQAKQLVHT